MPRHLRAIAVTIVETEQGGFEWCLLEQSGKRWTTQLTAEESLRSYRKAMAAGLLALQGLIEDLDAGPREGDDAGEAVDDGAEAEAPESEPASVRKTAAGPFGFGKLK